MNNTNNQYKNHITKGSVNSSGYLNVRLHKDGISSTYKVHRLVAEAFIDNPKGYRIVNHKDEDKTNNCVKNLEWCNDKYNANYGTRTARIVKKMEKPVIQLKDGVVIARYDSAIKAEKATGIKAQNIRGVLRYGRNHAGGYQWKYAMSEE